MKDDKSKYNWGKRGGDYITKYTNQMGGYDPRKSLDTLL